MGKEVIKDLDESVGEKLKIILRSRNMRPSQLAQAAGLSTSTVDDIIKGKTNELSVGVDKMLKIAEALGVTVEELYERGKPPDPGERQLLDRFRSLNEEGREKALDYLGDLVDTGKYKKRDPSGVVLEA